MRQVVWASVRLYARRYVATVVAIVVGVGFIVTIDVLSSAVSGGLLADATAQYVGAGTVVSDVPDLRTARRVLTAAPGTSAVNAEMSQPLAVNGRNVTDDGLVTTVATDPTLRWQALTDGRFPTRPGQALVDVNAAHQNDVHLGDRVTVGRDRGAPTVRVTGFAASSSGRLAAPLYLTWADLASFRSAVLVDNVVTTSRDTDAVRRAVPAELTVDSRDDYLQQVQAEASQGIDVIAILLLVFAAIAFFVSALVIANTFSVLLAQRVRDFALLRCVGASRRQIRRSVLAEALLIGVSSSTAGVLAGWGFGTALAAVGGAAVPALPLGRADLSPVWVVSAWLLGVLVTTAASLVPTIRGTRVSPLAALRPDDGLGLRTSAGRWRTAAAVVFLGGGAGLLTLSIPLHNLLVMIVGGAVSFVGVLLVGPVLVPACIRVLGTLGGRFGVPGRLAASNSLRNPRRTAATAASLLVGVTLIAGLVVGMATTRSAIDAAMQDQYPLDLTVTSAGRALQPDALARVRAVDGVAAAAALPGVRAVLLHGGHPVARLPFVGVDSTSQEVLRADAPFAHPAADVVFLPWKVLGNAQLSDHDRVVVRVGGTSHALRVRGADGIGQAGVVSASTLDTIAAGPTRVRAVWARAGAGADAADVRSAVATIGWSSDADVQGGLEQRAFVNLQLDVMTGAVVALLAVGVLIALVGIGNTLGLSVLERAREHAVLRALGLTRRQLRATLAAEALLLATVAGVLGVALGATYAWIAVQAVVGEVLGDVPVVLPVGRLLLLVLAAALAGLVACVLPARRAARIAPAEGLSAD